jgi:hypothetical protein
VKRLWAVAACVLVGCGTQAPPLLAPDRIESFCPGSPPAGAEITAILSSVADRIEPSTPYPGDAAVRLDVRQNGGAVGHWASQALYMPATAHELGIAGSYIDVADVTIDNLLAGSESRLIYVTVTTPNGPKGIVLRAYDTTDVCGGAPIAQPSAD